jgi:hypothetical protein
MVEEEKMAVLEGLRVPVASLQCPALVVREGFSKKGGGGGRVGRMSILPCPALPCPPLLDLPAALAV